MNNISVSIYSILTWPIMFCVSALAACSDDAPTGPCSDETGFPDEMTDSGSDIFAGRITAGPAEPAEPANDFRPTLPDAPDGWLESPGLDGFQRYATSSELRRLNLPEHSLVVTFPFGALETVGSKQAWIALPTWQADLDSWATDDLGQVIFDRQELRGVQTLALGHFVEHHASDDHSSAIEIRRPIFTLYGAENHASRSQALTDSSGALLLRRETPSGSVQLSAPHSHERLDVSPPLGFQVAVVSPSQQSITRAPLTPFDCENGACEDPEDPLDECNDGIDNDGDGHGDLCDWNCLPHSDFGAHHFPDARSRVEEGKSYALMGGGDICTELGDTWMVTFADWSLQASDFLNEVRPDINDSVRYRTFSCWTFESEDALQDCQHGYKIVNGEPVGDPSCPQGMEDYPYQTYEADPDPGLLLFDEATEAAWQDFELNTLALGPYGEPAHGVGFLTSDTTATCSTSICSPAAGLAYTPPNIEISNAGKFVVTDQNPYDWHTLAHETAHTLAIQHDDYAGGFMNAQYGPFPKLGMTVGNDDPNEPFEVKVDGKDNNDFWQTAFSRKHSHPRSPGWRWTGCYEVDNPCSPLGLTGWSCDVGWCEPDSPF